MDLGLSIAGTGLRVAAAPAPAAATSSPARKAPGGRQPRSPLGGRGAGAPSGPSSPSRLRNVPPVAPAPSQVLPAPKRPAQPEPVPAAESVQEVAEPPPVADPSPPPPPPPPPPPLPEADGSCRLRYNHYNDAFHFKKGCLSPAEVNARYAFDFVFKGRFRLHLLLSHPDKSPVAERPVDDVGVVAAAEGEGGDGGGPVLPHVLSTYTFVGLVDGAVYTVEVEDDPEEKAKAANAPRGPELDAVELTRLRMAAEHATKKGGGGR
jgi:hypothetical protein